MDFEMRYDWQEVVDIHPQGYLEIQSIEMGIIVHGPIESIFVDEFDFVIIKLKWAAQMGMMGRSSFMKWKNSPHNKTIMFPNLMVPFVVDDTLDKGKRVRFMAVNILYVDPVEGLDPSRIEGLEILPS